MSRGENRLDIAVRAAKEAGKLLGDNLGSTHSVEFKGAIDLVTEMDKAAESLIVSIIEEHFPDDGILAEEGAEKVASKGGVRWIIDPLDGTTNYSHGYPLFCVSIAIEEEGTVTGGVVYGPLIGGSPSKAGELYVAALGRGATLNGDPIKVSTVDGVARSLLSTGFPYNIRTSADNNIDRFTNFSLRGQAIRRAGAAALDLAHTAAGRFDGFWEGKLKPWDVAAGTLLVTEAGGTVTDYKGGPFSIYSDECLASNGLIHEEMIEVIGLKGVKAPLENKDG